MFHAVRPIAMQASFFAAMGLGVYTLRRLSTVPLHPSVAACPEIAQKHPAIAETLSQLAKLDDGDAFHAVLRMVAAVVSIDEQGGPAAQWHISRQNTQIVRRAKSMCSSTNALKTDDAFRVALNCQEETIPQLESHLDNLLHNHILRRG